MKKVKVRCTFEIEVNVEDNENSYFFIEENGCPGTGIVGSALNKIIDKADKEHWCWACYLNGKNEIIKVTEIG